MEMLAAWRAEHQAVEGRLVELVEAAGYGTPTPRLKAAQTIIGKLRLMPRLSLWDLRDILGCRLVLDAPLSKQERVTVEVAAAFPGAKRIDRCKDPRSGYRAQHLEVRIEGYRAEIQIRTLLQHGWAELYERLGDRMGRQIRHQGAPNDASKESVPGMTNEELLSRVQDLSGTIAMVEEKLNKYGPIAIAAVAYGETEQATDMHRAWAEETAQFAVDLIVLKNDLHRATNEWLSLLENR